MNVQFYLLTCLLTVRFKITHNFIKKLNNHIRFLKSSRELDEFETILERIVNIHQKLTSSARELNRLFAIQLVFNYILILISILSNGYVCLFLLAYEHEVQDFALFVGFKYFLYHVLEGLLLVKGCYDLCESVS